MTPPPGVADAAVSVMPATATRVPIPRYLEQAYWWAYVHPRAVHAFERKWLVNVILFGNYGRLRDSALAELGETVGGKTLQIACVYGDLTPRLHRRLAPDACLDVVDVLPIQLRNLAAKLPREDSRVRLTHGDSSALACADATYDRVLLFFLLHEQPARVRRSTLAEAMRVVKPGGKIVIVDYHRPARWNPLEPLVSVIFRRLEPYAIDFWRDDVVAFFPPGAAPATLAKQTYFGGLYQKLVVIR